MYPKGGANFSDVVGASHGKSFNIFKINSYASAGLRTLAEHGNTTELEKEILVKVGNYAIEIFKI